MHASSRPLRAPLRRLDLPILAWMLVAVVVAGSAAALHAQQLRQLLEQIPARAESARLAALTAGAALVLAGLLWLVPARWRRLALAVCVGVSLIVPALISGHAAALVVVVALLLLSCWPGRVGATLLLRPADRLTAWVVGSAYGV